MEQEIFEERKRKTGLCSGGQSKVSPVRRNNLVVTGVCFASDASSGQQGVCILEETLIGEQLCFTDHINPGSWSWLMSWRSVKQTAREPDRKLKLSDYRRWTKYLFSWCAWVLLFASKVVFVAVDCYMYLWLMERISYCRSILISWE